MAPSSSAWIEVRSSCASAERFTRPDRALRASALMRAWFDEEIGKRRASGELGADMMGALMRRGDLDNDGVRRILGGMLVGSIDTTASSVAKIAAVIGRDKELA